MSMEQQRQREIMRRRREEEARRPAHLEEDRARLRGVTNGWSKPVVARQYDSDERGNASFEVEAAVLLAEGYTIQSQGAEGSHLHAGRLLLTGGLSVLAGRRGIRSKGKVTVTYIRSAS